MDKGLFVAKMWHEILMKSTTADEVEKYKSLMGFSPVEIRIMLIAGAMPDLLLREYVEQLHIPKSTLTGIIDRLENNGYLKRVINSRDKRSFGLELQSLGRQFLNTYSEYQKMIGTKIIKGLNEREQEQLIELLSKIASYTVV